MSIIVDLNIFDMTISRNATVEKIIKKNTAITLKFAPISKKTESNNSENWKNCSFLKKSNKK